MKRLIRSARAATMTTRSARVLRTETGEGRARCAAALIAAVMASVMTLGGVARAQGPTTDFQTAFARAFAGVDACVVLRDVAPGAQPAVSDKAACEERLPPCAVFEIAANVIALDRGLVPDADAVIRRDPPPPPAANGEPAPETGVNLRDAFRRPVPWVYEEIARRIGPDAFGRALQALRYGNADAASAPVESMWLGDGAGGLRISAVEQVDFLARLKRGELPTSAESQARTVEVIPYDRLPDGLVAWKSGQCGPAQGPKVVWAVGWVDRSKRSTIFTAVEKGERGAGTPAAGTSGVSADDAVARMRALLRDLEMTPQVGP